MCDGLLRNQYQCVLSIYGRKTSIRSLTNSSELFITGEIYTLWILYILLLLQLDKVNSTYKITISQAY